MNIMKKQMLINGVFVDSQSGQTLDVISPATNEICGRVPSAVPAEIDQAVEAADAAFPAWSETTAFYRGELLRAASTHVRDQADEIARIMTMEQGKPFLEAKGEVLKGADILRYYAEEGERVYGRIIPNADGNDIVSQVIYQPIGVAACISPWNYPIELLAWKLAAAMAAGCTCVIKVPSETPLSPITFVETVLKASFPKGVINIVTGPGKQIGDLLTMHPKVNKVAFTGSTAVGKHIAKNCAETLKHVSLELGGSEPMIVCVDADLDAAAKGACRRSFRNMGQICIAINRIYADASIYDVFLEKFAKEVQALTIGNGLEEPCDLGPMCTVGGVMTAKRHVADALEKGAVLVCGGKAPKGHEFTRGNYFEPTILKDVTHDMIVMKEETFGPVVGVMPFHNLEEAINLANDTPYGLAAIVYTQSLSTASQLTRRIQAGNVAVNNVDAGVINAPYGGWKESGYGHEHGPEGLYHYLHTKHIRIRTL